MSELTYDPEFPYVLVNVNNEIHTRWANKKFADRYLEEEWSGYGRVIDTTPKPKIPVDAEFIYWKHGNTDYYARHVGGQIWLDDMGDEYSYHFLVENIEGAEVTVLVRKEDA